MYYFTLHPQAFQYLERLGMHEDKAEPDKTRFFSLHFHSFDKLRNKPSVHLPLSTAVKDNTEDSLQDIISIAFKGGDLPCTPFSTSWTNSLFCGFPKPSHQILFTHLPTHKNNCKADTLCLSWRPTYVWCIVRRGGKGKGGQFVCRLRGKMKYVCF